MPSSTRCLSTFFRSCSLRQHNDLFSAPPLVRAPTASLPRDENPHAQASPSLSSIIEKRMQSLPRSQLEATNPYERNLLEKIQREPSRQTARTDVWPLIRLPYEIRAQRRKSMNAAWKENLRKGRVDWLPYAEKLQLLISRDTPPASKRILHLNEDFIRYYVGRSHSNMWVVRDGGNADALLLPPNRQTAERLVVLSGTQSSVQHAVEFLMSKARLFKKGHKHHYLKGMRLDRSQIESPSNFSWYVNRIIASPVPREAQREIQIPRHVYTAQKLLDVFYDERASRYASIFALRWTFRYLCKHDDLHRMADQLFQRAKELGLKCDSAICNMILKQAIFLNQEDRVAALLEEMDNACVPATEQTWVLFLGAVNTDAHRLAVLKLMEGAGIQPNSVRLAPVLGDLLADEMRVMPDSHEDFTRALDMLFQRFGTDWLNQEVYQAMVHAVIGRRDHKLRALPHALLALPGQHGMTITRRVEMLQFQLYRHQRNIDVLLEHFRDILRRDDGQPVTWFVAYAFMTAWSRQSVNVCRVLWMHAASYGNIYRTMLSVISKSLRTNTVVTGQGRNWARHAGILIIGSDLDNTGFRESFPRLSRYCSHLPNVKEWLSLWTPDDGTRDEQLSLAYVLVYRDLNAWKRRQGMSHIELDLLLTEAYKRDLQTSWSETVPFADLEQRVIDVPLRDMKLSVEDVEAAKKEVDAVLGANMAGLERWTMEDDTEIPVEQAIQ